MSVKAQWIILGCLILLVNKEECSQASCKYTCISLDSFSHLPAHCFFLLIISLYCVSVSLSSANRQWHLFYPCWHMYMAQCMSHEIEGKRVKRRVVGSDPRRLCTLVDSMPQQRKSTTLSSLTQINYGETILHCIICVCSYGDGPEWNNKMKRIKLRVNQ